MRTSLKSWNDGLQASSPTPVIPAPVGPAFHEAERRRCGAFFLGYGGWVSESAPNRAVLRSPNDTYGPPSTARHRPALDSYSPRARTTIRWRASAYAEPVRTHNEPGRFDGRHRGMSTGPAPFFIERFDTASSPTQREEPRSLPKQILPYGCESGGSVVGRYCHRGQRRGLQAPIGSGRDADDLRVTAADLGDTT